MEWLFVYKYPVVKDIDSAGGFGYHIYALYRYIYMNNPTQTLAKLGLSDKEAAVYFALLKLGQGSAQAIARISGLKRPTTYVILEELRRKGLALKAPGSAKQMFSALSPEELVREMRKNVAETEHLLPELMRLYQGSTARIKTVYFEGIEGIKQVMDYKLGDGQELVAFWAIEQNVPKELSRYFIDWAEKLKQKKITMRGIVPEHPTLKKYRAADAAYGRDIKTVPFEQFSSEVAIDTSGDIVRIHDYKNLQGIVIENADVAKTVREIFEMLWTRV